MPTPQDAEKTMSSRLLTMKFMQRAGASPQTPSASPSGHSSKRMRLSNGTASPVTPSSALQDALDPDEARRLKALEKHAEAMGETRWVLSVQEKPRTADKALNIVTASFGDIDALSDDDTQEYVVHGKTTVNGTDDTPAVGRRVFGNMKKRPSDGHHENSSNSDSSSSSSDGYDDDDPAAQLIRAERREAAAQAREKRRAERKENKAESDRLAAERRKKEVKLNKLTSISGGGGSKTGGRSGTSTPSKEVTCYKCGKLGHTRAMCPTR